MDFRQTYSLVTDGFDKWRQRYCPELFAEVIRYAGIDERSSVLEIGPGTGQASEPFLRTGCDYSAIELSPVFVDFMRSKFSSFPNLRVYCGEFEQFNPGEKRFDLVFSAATIQWIPEQIAFSRCYSLLKPGGVLAMFMTRTDERTPNAHFYDRIQQAYDIYFRPEKRYTCHMVYENAVHYGFEDFHYMDWKQRRVYSADEYVQYLAATQVEHITLQEPYRSRYYEAVHAAVAENGDRMIHDDTTALYLARKPMP